MVHTIQWNDGRLFILDQTELPVRCVEKELRTLPEVWEAIRTLRVRGAPAIGVTAAFGILVALNEKHVTTVSEVRDAVDQAADYLASARPTAVNLFWALDRMRRVAREPISGDGGADIKARLEAEALAIFDEDQRLCRAIGEHGASLIHDGEGVLTHCNAGGLATAGYGTALGVLFKAHESGKRFRVFADETRPLLQGARLTAWELQRAGIHVTVICDNMAAWVMHEGRVQVVIVGADRIAANGDTANKIGTYALAVLAKAHGIPFYVAAPFSTFDLACARGDRIPIEERDADEVVRGFGVQTAPEGVDVYNPAFDVTPARLITGIVTEKGLVKPPYEESIPAFAREAVPTGRAANA